LDEAVNRNEKEQMVGHEPNNTITVDGIEYKLDDLSDAAKVQLSNIAFVDERIQQISNEWAVSDTARLGYTSAFKGELLKHDN
jgi:hypothetical protein